MRNLITFEDWLILERSKTVEYFRQNPEALSQFSKGIDKHRNDWDPRLAKDQDIESTREKKIRELFYKKISRLPGVDVPYDPDKKDSWTIGEVLSGQKPGYSDWWDWKSFAKDMEQSRNIDDLLVNSSTRKRFWTFPGEGYSDRRDLSQYGKLFSFIKTNFDTIKKNFKWIETALDGIKGSSQKSYEKELMKLGLSVRDVEVAMSYVQEWTSMSRKKLDPSVWPLLQKISVDPTKLPKYLYRGIFYDGAKIKDFAKWSKQWHLGSKPGASQGKATSWSVDRGTAIEFMTDQDFIKDKDNGYYMLLKWEVDPKLVIADLRNLPVDHKFWNQQEVIVSPEAKNYEVDTMISGKEGYEGYKKFASENPGGQGAWGATRSEMAMRFLQMPFDKISPGDKMEFKRISKMTVGEFKAEYPKAPINANETWSKVGMPLWNYIDRHFWKVDIVSSSRTEVKFILKFSMDDFNYSSSGPEIYSLYQKISKETPFNQFYGKDAIVSNEGTIRLVNDDFYNMDIEVKWPTEFELVKGAKKPDDKSEPREEDRKTDGALEKMFTDSGGSKFFVNWSKTKQAEKGTNLSRNINIKLS